MIYAIPHSRDCVANHFMKAKQFVFLNEQSQFIKNIDNPAAEAGCSCHEKKATISRLKEMQTDAIIVRNIGERALGKLLKSGIRVFKLTQKTSISMALNSPMIELTSASSGRPSQNHLKKGKCSGHSGGCCGQHEKKETLMGSISSLSPLKKR
ncbi:NifB/NifX family molybdenum-iron cluster-binding protein [Vibrio sp. TH_r3]|uniref:NifB/NifX family molybdenum-iron cluster-binding protein n=1 Tax=Vibrio sp. TH_r3 TaxID=3082084 RepID=UPI0029536B61|nr:NifB/NifX family molybdenum-iron cluster-binding protein [Vibrio sp. TH_r3]MDV7105284.1 NifB/NifX family molybdenum-iron cluster-binding protein [Vibrio sp. TH_r3]